MSISFGPTHPPSGEKFSNLVGQGEVFHEYESISFGPTHPPLGEKFSKLVGQGEVFHEYESFSVCPTHPHHRYLKDAQCKY